MGAYVPAVAFAAHGASDALRGQPLLIVLTGILHSSIGMCDQAFTGQFSLNRHLESIHDQSAVNTLGHRPADDLPGIQIFDCGQIQPSFIRGDVGDIRDQI